MERNEFERRFALARRQVIERDFAHLNDMQRKSVLATEGPLLLLAGAGSGKTTVLIDRIANLIRYGRGSDSPEVPEGMGEAELALLEAEAKGAGPVPEEVRELCALDPVEPWRVIAITFTNKAADELKARLERKLGPGAGEVWAMTFHSACVRILRKSIEALGISPNFTIYDAADSVAVMKRVLRELNLDEKQFPPKSVLAAISRAKDKLQSPADFAAAAEKGWDPRQKYIARAYTEYARRLLAADALDFDDLIYYTVLLLRDYPEERDYWRRRFRYVLVDEYQDTSHAQYLLAATLAGERENICVVGDDDQSIYRFRGATIENILSFENRFKNARVIKLEQNYRSTGHILNAANAVIRHNAERRGKNLWTSAGDGEKLRLVVSDGDDAEAEFVADSIVSAVAGGMRWSDFAVLYRMNVQSNRLEYAFKRRAIPYKVVGGTRFFDRAEIKDMTSYLAVVNNPADDLRLLRIVNTPARGIGDTTVERLRALAAAQRRPILDIAADAGSFPELKNAAGKLMKFLALIMELRTLSESLPLEDFYDALLEKTGYLEALGDSDEALARRDNIMELKSNIVSYAASAETPTLAGFLDEIALYSDLDSVDTQGESVILMTIHAAKGLEFPWVFLVGMEENVFPSSRSTDSEEDLEEERRLCYVALTRAKRRLTLTAARRRLLFGHTTANAVSRFVEEIPEGDIDKPADLRMGSEGFTREPDPEWLEYRRREKSPFQEAPRRGFGGGSETPRRGFGGPPQGVRRPPAEGPKTASPSPKTLPTLSAGDVILHKAFGEGAVVAVTTMPGDALLTVDFHGSQKRLMLKAAAPFITKK